MNKIVNLHQTQLNFIFQPASSCPQTLYNWKQVNYPEEMISSDLIDQMVIFENIERLFKNKFGIPSSIGISKSSIASSAERSADVLICLEFRIIKDPQDQFAPIREINSHFQNNEFYFELGGYIHGKQALSEKLRMKISGRQIIKSIESRIKEFQDLQYQVGWTHEAKKNSSTTYFVPLIDDRQRIIIEFYSPKLSKLQDFNPQFSKLLFCNGQIKRIFIQLSINLFNEIMQIKTDNMIGLQYIQQDLLKQRKAERDRLKKKRNILLRELGQQSFQLPKERVSHLILQEIKSLNQKQLNNVENIENPEIRDNDEEMNIIGKFLYRCEEFIQIDEDTRIIDLMRVLNDLAALGIRFIDKDFIDENSDIHVFSPMISIISFEFKEIKEKIRIEIPFSSIYSQSLPFDYILEVLPQGTWYIKLIQLDLATSFIGLNWVYKLNLKSKIQPIKLPSILIYYKFASHYSQIVKAEQEQNTINCQSPIKLKLRTIGLQANSQKLILEWLKSGDNNIHKIDQVMQRYYEINSLLREFIDLDKEIQSKRNFKRSLLDKELTGEVFHQDFHDYQNDFFEQ
ncbi:UNKNOWN [Stylonychia lemnae]|uniref:Uncharacterized protein n=1 Tax=Stylonychia lemnae TaxID=5949 RepID=A0A078AW93_STYLE|nr:UNKNOWN [Stylonychia lemnae]|eukprot:CDW86346.1 UNKNOWN [Stylonychia lemnae]